MRRSWLETRVEVRAELADLVAVHLVELGSPGLIDENAGAHTILVAYFDDRGQVEAVRRRLASIAPDSTVAVREISDEDWAENWKVNFPPLAVGERLQLCPPWAVEPPPGRLAVVIDPGMAFGTGHHTTTRACLELLERCDPAGRDVLDLGTGSGVLSIAALLLGARRAVGVDVDPIALAAARDNAARNRVADRFELSASIDEVADDFDLALANLQLDVLLEMAPAIAARLRPGGLLIASGLLREQLEPWSEAYSTDWEICESAGDEQWVAVLARRRGGAGRSSPVARHPSPVARRRSPAPGPRPPAPVRVRIEADAIRDDVVVVAGGELHHLRVRRVEAGDSVTCFDAGGNEYAGRVRAISGESATLEIGAASQPGRESPLSLTLAQAVLKGDHLDLVVEKATELGVGEIILFDCERAVARPSKARLERLDRIAASAAKQSGRVRLPSIRGPLAFDEVLAEGAIVFHPGAAVHLDHGLGDFAALTVIVGPEGGFSASEIERAAAAGCRIVGLGPRVLRAETAAVVVCGLCQYLWGDLPR